MAGRDRETDTGADEMKYNGTIYKSINTCRDCPDRHPACHDHCEKYQEALAEWKEKKQSIKHTKKMHREFDKFRIYAMSRLK